MHDNHTEFCQCHALSCAKRHDSDNDNHHHVILAPVHLPSATRHSVPTYLEVVDSYNATTMTTKDEERALTRSLFSKRDEDGTLEESLVSYIKVFEDDGGHGKTRYLMLASEWTARERSASDAQ